MSSKAKFSFLRIVLGVVVILFVFAVLIANLMRSPMIADPVSPGAAGAMDVRSINTAEITYATTYEKAGYAPNLAVLGPAESGSCDSTHACLLDRLLACSAGVGQNWCIKGAYRYNVQSSQPGPPYKDYWVTATPVHADPKLRNYCSTADAVLRWQQADPLNDPYTLDECLTLPSIN